MTALLLIMGAMEVSMSVRIIYLEFQMQAAKYITKRLMGADFFDVYGGFFMTTVVLCVLGAYVPVS